MDAFLKELTDGLPDTAQIARVFIRLIAAALFGAVMGIQRERAGKRRGYGRICWWLWEQPSS